MLKDSNIDPPLVGANENKHPVIKAHESLFGQVSFPNSPNHASSKLAVNLIGATNSPQAKEANTPRSTHKVVTPLRKQNSSFLVASLESLFSDSQGVSEQIAKITASSTTCNSTSNIKSPATSLAHSFASLSTFSAADTLTDPTLLHSHVQKSLETSAIGFESSPYNSSNQRACSAPMKNSLYSTPIRCKQSRSHDFSELPSQQRLKQRRSSILAQEDADLLTLDSLLTISGGVNGEIPLSDLSHFKDNEEVIPIEDKLIKLDNNSNMELNNSASSNEFNYFEQDDCDEGQRMEISPMKLATKRHHPASSSALVTKRNFSLPSTTEYRDGSKPPFSYASLIAQAIVSSPKQRLALSSIYSWIMETYPYYQVQTCGWQNSIRHNLSLNKCFKKIPRDDDEPGKGAYWTVDLEEMDDFEDGMFKRRRTCSSNSSGTSNSVLNSPTCNNAFLNGTGWSPLLNNSPHKNNISSEFRTPQATKIISTVNSVPMTPLTMSINNPHHKTPVKKSTEETFVTVVTPKVATNCINRSSPYTTSTATTNLMSDTPNFNSSCNTATFWSYPNMSLSQLGLDAEPPQFDNETIFNSIFNNEQIPLETSKLPELFQGHPQTQSQTQSQALKDQFRLSPLSWLLSVSSQDTSSMGLFDQSQQLLSEYLNKI